MVTEFDKAKAAFSMLQLDLGDSEHEHTRAPTDEIVKDYDVIIEAMKAVERSAVAHGKRVEESAV